MNKKGVSAIIGVILMVAITVAIAATVYVYVDSLRQQEQEEPELYVEGTVTSVVEYTVIDGFIGDVELDNVIVYNITLDGNSYLMMFRSSDAVVPPTQVDLRFYYNILEGDQNYYDVYKIKSL